MTAQETTPQPPGCTVHLGGDAWCIPELEPQLVLIDTVHDWPGNPRRHDQEQITGSIRDHGLYAGVVTQSSSGRLLLGHGRKQGLLDLGATRIPRVVMDVDDTRGAAIVARDNKTHDAGGYDDRDLYELLAPLAESDELLALAGFHPDDLADLERVIANLDFVENAAAGTGDPVNDISDPLNINADTERITVTVDTGTKAKLYALLDGLPWVRDWSPGNVFRTYRLSTVDDLDADADRAELGRLYSGWESADGGWNTAQQDTAR